MATLEVIFRKFGPASVGGVRSDTIDNFPFTYAHPSRILAHISDQLDPSMIALK